MKNQPERQRRFFEQHLLGERLRVSANLEHGNRVHVVELADTDYYSVFPGDALVSKRRDCLLAVTVADCLPIYFYDYKRQAVAIAHAGWRGVSSWIVLKVVEKMISRYYSVPADIKVIIGPHIRKCHFEVKSDVAAHFSADDTMTRNAGVFVDLSAAVCRQLASAGISAHHIFIHPDCTYCHPDRYFSFRRDRPAAVEAMIAYIGLA